jgi:predicted phosphodiesterase
MIVRLFSDLHIDGRVYTITPQAHDPDAVLILAGDTSGYFHCKKAVQFVTHAAENFRYVLFVAGNHEFYNGEYFAVKKFWDGVEQKIDNFFFLDNRVKVIDDVRFIGTTLWTDMEGGNPIACMTVQGALNDYYVIGYRTRRLMVADTVAMYNEAIRFLDKELAEPFAGKTAVITHHTPSFTLITPEFRTSRINGGFHSNSDRLFYDYDIDYWFYGHTHISTNTVINDTHVISNQRGYYGERVGIDHDFWLDI